MTAAWRHIRAVWKMRKMFKLQLLRCLHCCSCCCMGEYTVMAARLFFFKQDSSFSCCKTFLSVHKTFHCLYAKKFHYRILLQQWCNPQWRINVYLVFAFTRLRAEHCFVRVWITHQSLWTCIASASIHCVIFKLSFLFYSPSYFIVFLSMWKWSSWMSISCLHLAIWKEKNT